MKNRTVAYNFFAMALVLVALAFAIASSGCQWNRKPDSGKVQEALVYFRDGRTGLCFATVSSDVNGYDVVSVTCVPCDSLKNLTIKSQTFEASNEKPVQIVYDPERKINE